MRRRTLLQKLLGLIAALPFVRRGASANVGEFSPQQRRALGELAVLVLPSELGESGTAAAAAKFEQYVRAYRAGADTDHGYGFTHVVPKPPSPVATYAEQLSSLPAPVKRSDVVELLQRAKVKELPRVPDGKNVVADLMSFYFRSSEANDLCYSAYIGRDDCRGLTGSERQPAPLRRSA